MASKQEREPRDRIRLAQPYLGTLKLPLVEDWRKDDVEPRRMMKVLNSLGLRQELRTSIIRNMADDAWKKGPEKKLAKERLHVFDDIYGTFCRLADSLGWDDTLIASSSAVFMPLIDISERGCYTVYGHQYRTMQYAEIILESKNITGNEKTTILLGTLIHDIGKATVDAELLRAKERLSREEIDRIRRHVRAGKEIIDATFIALAGPDGLICGEMEAISAIASSHQEKFDGGGYEQGLAGQNIAFGARVAAFCDTMDATTSLRIYQGKPPRDFEDMKKMARMELDKHFNAKIVSAFLAACEDPEIRERIFQIMRSGGGRP